MAPVPMSLTTAPSVTIATTTINAQEDRSAATSGGDKDAAKFPLNFKDPETALTISHLLAVIAIQITTVITVKNAALEIPVE